MNPLLDKVPGCHGLKFPRFVIGWMITDIVMLSFHLLFCLLLMFVWFNQPCAGILRGVPISSLFVVAVGFFVAIGMLCKRRWALSVGYIEAVLCLINLIGMFAIWCCGLYMHASDISLSFERQYEAQITLFNILPDILLFVTRITLFVFYCLALARAKRYFLKRGY